MQLDEEPKFEETGSTPDVYNSDSRVQTMADFARGLIDTIIEFKKGGPVEGTGKKRGHTFDKGRPFKEGKRFVEKPKPDKPKDKR